MPQIRPSREPRSSEVRFITAVAKSRLQTLPSIDRASEPASAIQPGAFRSRPVAASDLPAIEALHDQVFGPGALTRAAYRVREGQPRLSPFCRVMFDGCVLVAAIRYTEVRIGESRAILMLGPLAVAPAYANQGHGRKLLAESLERARSADMQLILLIGDPPYYARFGFVVAPRGRIIMPGPIDAGRLLVLELQPGAVLDLQGRVQGLQ